MLYCHLDVGQSNKMGQGFNLLGFEEGNESKIIIARKKQNKI